MKVVTSGLSFLDIDAYAGCIAYAELLNLQGIDAIAFSSATINESVSKTIRSWKAPLSTDYQPSSEDTFILIDVSEPDFIEKTVDIDRVEEVIDHHVGYEDFWKERIGHKANLEFVGAACTQIYESWVKAGRLDEMSETSARLLICGILDNTLDFEATVTTDRDYEAWTELLTRAHLPADWTARYFKECEESIFSDIRSALVNDTKIMKFHQLSSDNVAFGQLVIWDGERVIKDYRETVESVMAARAEDWFVNVVDILGGKSIFLASNAKVIQWAEKILDVTFGEGLAYAKRLWLRKEIVKQDSSTKLSL